MGGLLTRGSFMTTVVQRPQRLLLTVETAGRRLGLSRSTMYRLIAAREINSILIRGSRRISTAALDEYVRHLEREQSRRPETAESAEAAVPVRRSPQARRYSTGSAR